MVKRYCEIRGDLVEKYGIPIEYKKGTVYLRGKGKHEYRWTSDTEGFQIKYKGVWCDALSIDFDF